MSVRLYGASLGEGSHARVTRGFRSAFERAEILAGFVPLDAQGIDDHIAREQDPLARKGGGATHGFFTGALGQVELMLETGAHQRRWVMVAPNSTEMPSGLVRVLRRVATDIMAPSAWAARMLQHYFSDVCTVTCVPHGVDADLVPNPELRDCTRLTYDAGAFVVLHFSTSDRQRKGTLELIRGWKIFQQRGGPKHELVLILDSAAEVALTELLMDARELEPDDRITIAHRMNISSGGMAKVLACAHAVCQPSRGEAFGMVPLEALCCGVPIVATDCTGHSQWLEPFMAGAVTVPTGALAPIDDLPGALAPSLEPEDIANALEAMQMDWRTHEQAALANADALRSKWLWQRQLSPLVEQLKNGR